MQKTRRDSALRNAFRGKEENQSEKARGPLFYFRQIPCRLQERGGGNPDNGVDVSEPEPYEVARNLCLARTHLHEQRARAKLRQLFNSRPLV